MPESNRIEYKITLTDNLEKEVVAFLNYREGGIIYLGIEDDGTVVGLDEIDEAQLKIKDRLKNNILPSCLGLFDVIHEERDGKDIIRINVASGTEKPYYIKRFGMSERGAYIRIGSASEPMTVRMIEDLFAGRTRNSLGKIKANRQDLSFEQLKIYYNESGFNLTDKFAYNLELLTETGDFNYVAYLLADENSNTFKVAKYAGTDRIDLIESNEYGYCSLIKAAKQILDKLDLENPTATTITHKERIDERRWNPVALREAVINAIVHNDYSNEVFPKFEIFSDRLEITSAGGLVAGLSQEEFFEGHSVPRNKEIMRIFKDLEMVEYLGSGMPRILQYYDKDCFSFSENFLRIVFPSGISPDPDAHKKTEGFDLAHWQQEFGLISDRLTLSTDKNMVFLKNAYGAFTGYLRDNYGVNAEQLEKTTNERSLWIIILMLLEPDLTRQNIADILGKSLSSIEKDIKTLRKINIVTRSGSDKTGKWEIQKSTTTE